MGNGKNLRLEREIQVTVGKAPVKRQAVPVGEGQLSTGL